MKRSILVALGIGTIISSAAAIGIGAAWNSAPRSMTRAQYDSTLADIETARPLVLARCEALPGLEKELCRVEAAAEEMVRAADIEATFRRTRDSARAAQRARIEARYLVDRTRCAALGGSPRDRCLIAAHAARGRLLLEAATPYESRG